MNYHKLHQLAYRSLIELSTKEGINASGKDEVYGCVFGRDSAITVLKILRANNRRATPELLEICRKALKTLVKYQGKIINPESGETPGKFIHELRKSKYGHLTKGEKPWYVYPDKILRNYDSIDSTPLTLIAIYKYWQTTNDNKFLLSVLPAVELGLYWLIGYGDLNKDGFLEYNFPATRKFGGLLVQSWTDSHESLINTEGRLPKYPIAPIEAQALCWLALKLWADYFLLTSSDLLAKKLKDQAEKIKTNFNKEFIIKDQGLFYGAQALAGEENKIKTITANPLLCLYAAYQKDEKPECILDDKYLPDFVKRAFLPDMFVPGAGIRTMSSLSPTFNPNRDSYHNGSFWPMLNGLIVEGLENFGFLKEAKKLRESSLKPLEHFGYPIELYIKDKDEYLEYLSGSGQTSCHQQAWSAAAILDMTVED